MKTDPPTGKGGGKGSMIAFCWSLGGGLLGGALGGLVGMLSGSSPSHHVTPAELLQSALISLFFGIVPSALNAYLAARMSPKVPSRRHRAILCVTGAALIGLPLCLVSAVVVSITASL